MKTSKDPRHLKREKIIRQLYSFGFRQSLNDYKELSSIIKNLEIIDKKIQGAAPEWPLAKINRIDLAILRLAVFEILQNREPIKVIIDEAVELAKQYGSEKSPQFINGALGALISND